MAQAYQNGECANGARMALLDAGWPTEVPGVTLDRRCCGGLDSIFWAVMKIQTGNADIVVAGGMESMSQAEMYFPGDLKWGLGGKKDAKWGFMPRGHGAMAMWGVPLYDRVQRARVMSQPIERFGELPSMMTWAETAAQKENITRQAADEWSLRSHKKAIRRGIPASSVKKWFVSRCPERRRARPPADVCSRRNSAPRQQLGATGEVGAGVPQRLCTAGNSSNS